jgi:hypothetical protein
MKKLLVFLIVIAFAALFWVGFGLWAGLYAFYSIPPSEKAPDGKTLLVSRDENEPMFDSPDYVPPPPKPVENTGMFKFQSGRTKKPLEVRTIVELPYVEMAYKKSLEKEEASQ